MFEFPVEYMITDRKHPENGKVKQAQKFDELPSDVAIRVVKQDYKNKGNEHEQNIC